MMPRLILILASLLFVLPVGAEDFLKEAQDEANSQQDSPLVKFSSDHRIKVTLLYIGSISDPQIKSPFVVVYLREDCRTDEDLQRHHATPTPDGHFTDEGYLLTTYPPEVKSASRGLMTDSKEERARSYKGALLPDFKNIYPNVTIPAPDHPDRADVFEYFYKSIATGPFDIILHDRIMAYGENDFHFSDIDTDSFATP